MARFIVGSELNFEMEKLFDESEEFLTLISPFIKLHEKLKDVLKSKEQKENLQVHIVFGKNEYDRSKSFSEEEFLFFRQFPNLEIRYEERLHAKYYWVI